MALTLNLKGKVALITAITSVMGLAIARTMAQAGCTVIGCAPQNETSSVAQGFLADMESFDVHTDYFKADITDAGEIKNLVSDITNDYGRLDILVSSMTESSFTTLAYRNNKELHFNLNLSTCWQLVKSCKSLLAQNNGAIIVLSSNDNCTAIQRYSPDNIAEITLSDLLKSLALKLGSGISAIGIAPDFIDCTTNCEWFNAFENEHKKQLEVSLSN